jgi:hypothetical protein
MSGLADRLRGKATKFGLRSQRVFLCWSRFSGAERGEGTETMLARVEILPTPRVSDLTAANHRPYSHGTYKEGSIRVDQISVAQYTRDMLLGLVIPVVNEQGCVCGCRAIPAPAGGALLARDTVRSEPVPHPQIDFWWESVEDGRGDEPAARNRYRALSLPARQEGQVGWSITLELASEELSRLGLPQIGPDVSEKDPDAVMDPELGPL